MEKIDKFFFHKRYYEVLKGLSPEEIGTVVMALCRNVFDGGELEEAERLHQLSKMFLLLAYQTVELENKNSCYV